MQAEKKQQQKKKKKEKKHDSYTLAHWDDDDWYVGGITSWDSSPKIKQNESFVKNA